MTRASTGGPGLVLSLQQPDDGLRAALPRHRVQRWLRLALATDAAVVQAQFTVRVVGEAEGRDLNRAYRGRDYATNVLTFDYERGAQVVADLVLCAPVLQAEARQLQRALPAHCAHLVLHGALHALGHDHEEEAEARRMETLETALLARLGLPDPYA